MPDYRSLYSPFIGLPDPNQASSNLYGGSPLSGLAAALGNPLTTAHLGLGASYIGGLGALPILASQPVVGRWRYVIQRFTKLLDNITISSAQREDGEKKQAGVRACLNRHYWESASEDAHSTLIGSWGKETRGRPSRDIDLLFLLPPQVYHRFQERSGNRQSQLLQEVKAVLGNTYSQTTMRGDGQVVLIPFNTIPIEVAIGFHFDDGSIRVCDTNDGGKYIISTAAAELVDLDRSDKKWHGNIRAYGLRNARS